jgi:hypothetical protein
MNKALRHLQTLQAAAGLAACNALLFDDSVLDGDTVSIGGRVYECDDHKDSTIAPGNVRVWVFNGHANGTLNFSDTLNVVDGNTVTVGSKVYTFKAVLSNVDGYVKIGPTITRSIYNLVAAMNVGYPTLIDPPASYGELNDVGEGRGVAYAAAMTRNAADIKAFFGGDFDLQIWHWPGGTAGNGIAIDATLIGGGSWADGTEMASVPAPTFAQFAASFVSAVNNDQGGSVFAQQISDNEVVVWSRNPGDVQLLCDASFSNPTNAWEWPTLMGGTVAREDLTPIAAAGRQVTLGEQMRQRLHFIFGFQATNVFVQRRDAGGNFIPFDGNAVISGRRVTVMAGASGLNEGDFCNVIVFS